MPARELITSELAARLAEQSGQIGRQVGLLINRSGAVEYVIVGDERGIMIPELTDYPLGRRRLRGLRYIHTHLGNEHLSEDDLTDLSLLRLDLVAALLLGGRQLAIQLAHLVPAEPGKPPFSIEPPLPLNRLELDVSQFIDALEKGLERSVSARVSGGEEQGILVSVSRLPLAEVEDSLDELKELARTAGVAVLDSFVQRPRAFNPRYLMGEGKLRDLVIRALQLGATILIFDQELTPAQVRCISQMTELKVIDRSQLILDIFARRATSQDGKVQVELAQLKFLLPRLTGKGVQMSRLMGGIGGRGPGETKLETDRRRIRERIARLERELEELSRGRYQRRQKRIRSGVPIVSIVGYTNAGKSTLLNTLTQSRVFTEDLLFATLDTSTRRLRFPREREVIVTDTVGFIRSLPASLMGAFKATLEELQDADLLLHLVDCTSPRMEEQIQQVESILQDLGLADKERLLVFNKSDQLPKLKERDPLSSMKVRHLARRLQAIIVSAVQPSSLEPLLLEMERRFWGTAQPPAQPAPEGA